MSQTEELDTQPVVDWLNGLRLEQYCHTFQDVGLRTVKECQGLTATQLQHMGVALSGHQKRILLSLQKLFPSYPESEKKIKPVPKERTKFGTPLGMDAGIKPSQQVDTQSQDHSDVQRKSLPPIPPRATQNRPPLPFTHNSVPVSTESQIPTTRSRTVPIPAPRPRLNKSHANEKQNSGNTRSSSPTASSSSSSPSSEQFHLYEQCSPPGQAEMGIPPLPPKSYAVMTPKGPYPTPARSPRRPPVPPRSSSSEKLKPRSQKNSAALG